MTQPLVSIIVPVYNVQPWLNRCVGSIVKQTYHNLQIILIDDASGDESLRLCQEWERADPRVEVIVHDYNLGLSGARNTGLDKAAGDYIAFVDSDDYIEPDMISCLYEAMAKAGADLSVCTYQQEISESDLSPSSSACDDSRASVEVVNVNTFIKRALYLSSDISVAAWNKLYPREIFECVRYPLGRVIEDACVFPMIVDQCRTVAIVDRPLYHYCVRPTSITASWDCAKLGDWFFANSLIIDYLASRRSSLGDFVEIFYAYFACLAWVFLQKADLPINEKCSLQGLFRDYLCKYPSSAWSLPLRRRIVAMVIMCTPPPLAGSAYDFYHHHLSRFVKGLLS